MKQFLTIFLLTCCEIAFAADVSTPQPAESMRSEDNQTSQGVTAPPAHLRSWEAPAYESTVTGKAEVHEDELIGDYQQPRWSAKRRFPTTRIYVVPAGNAQFEYWWESKYDFDKPNRARYRSQFEFEFGLGHRLQLDLYITTQQQGMGRPMQLHKEKVELRYALADWGVIPGNPTLYIELAREHNGNPAIEGKILLGDQILPRLYWGANLVWERELGGSRTNEYAVTAALAYSAFDQVLSVGAEIRGEFVDVEDSRFDLASYELLAGPSIQWRPVPAMHIDWVGLFGFEAEKNAANEYENTALAQPMVVVGWEF